MPYKNILVANHHLEKIGGSETYTFALIEELKSRGYNVEYFTFFKGESSNRIEKDLGVGFMSKPKYDLILANHTTCIKYLSHKGKIIQTCHGIFPRLEQPSRFADGHVCISEEVLSHVRAKGFEGKVILNGINCKRYTSVVPINDKLTTLLSLCQSKEANDMLSKACEISKVNFKSLNKYENAIWNVESIINESDMVVGLGRSAYEAMACGRAVLIFDNRNYFKSYSDGYVDLEMINKSILNNCSGRYFKKELGVQELVQEINKYSKSTGKELQEFALENLNIVNQVNKYLAYADTITTNKTLFLKFLKVYQGTSIQIKKIKKGLRAKRSS